MSDASNYPRPHMPSPYGDSKITTGQHLAISAFWFATNFLWGALLTIMLPHEIALLAPKYKVPALSLFTGLAAIVALTVPLVSGALSDRCTHRLGRRRPFMIVGLIINVVGLLLMGLAVSVGKPIPAMTDPDPGFFAIVLYLIASPAFLTFLFAYIVVQLGNNIATAAYSGIIPDLVPHEQRGTASGFMALMSQMGTLFGAIGCGVLLGHFSEFVKYLVLLVVLVGVGLITILGIRETPLTIKPEPINWLTYLKSLWIDPKKYPDFAWVWITRALVMLGFYAVLPYINYFLGDVIGVKNPEGDAAMLIGIILIFSSISGIYGGHLSDKIGRKKVVYAANALIAVMALSFVFCHTLIQVILCGVLFGIGLGAYTSVDWALGTDVLPSKDDAAKEMAVWHIAMTLPQTLAAPIAGILIASYGVTTSFKDGEKVYHYSHTGYAAVFILCSVCFALGAYLLKNVRGVK